MTMPALPIYNLTPFTMLDFPERTACIIWFSGCNMRCAYCHNPDLVKGKGRLSVEEVLSFLEKRRGLLDGVVLSGGEATAYRDLPDLARTIKKTGDFDIKLDTNGLRPDIVRQMLEGGLVDYIALDYKAPPAKCKAVTGVDKFAAFEETLSMLCAQDSVPFEVRTTVHTGLVDEADIKGIMDDLDQKNYRGTYYIQNYRSGPTLKNLKEQGRALDIALLQSSENFQTEFRNF